jgi:lipid II:glycine glycyltransferase (peptidoglycan interpeptide bridge formation enzyme)
MQNTQLIFEPYFNQNKTWADFWKQVKGENHDYFVARLDGHEVYIYIYPFQLKSKYWFICGGGTVYKDGKASVITFKKLLQNIIEKARKEKDVAVVKMCWNEDYMSFLGIKSTNELHQLLSDIFKDKLYNPLSNVQTNSTIILNLTDIINTNSPVKDINNSAGQEIKTPSTSQLLTFLKDSDIFWKNTSSNVRRYTKKALEQNWQISIEKTEENFEAFYQLVVEKSKILDFYVHSKEYLHQVFKASNSHIIVLRNTDNVTCSVWFGFSSNSTMLYWYGANNDQSFKNYGQYLIHLIAIYICVNNSIPYYDLGGYNPNLSFSKFKELYHGRVLSFYGDYDIVINKNIYLFDMGLSKIKLKIKSIVKNLNIK